MLMQIDYPEVWRAIRAGKLQYFQKGQKTREDCQDYIDQILACDRLEICSTSLNFLLRLYVYRYILPDYNVSDIVTKWSFISSPFIKLNHVAG